jgi:hypothetical protein
MNNVPNVTYIPPLINTKLRDVSLIGTPISSLPTLPPTIRRINTFGCLFTQVTASLVALNLLDNIPLGQVTHGELNIGGQGIVPMGYLLSITAYPLFWRVFY